MELEVSLPVLQLTEEELNNCCRITRNCAEGLTEVLRMLEREMTGDAEVELANWLRKYRQNLWEDCQRLKTLSSGLQQVGEIYGQYEKELTLWQKK